MASVNPVLVVLATTCLILMGLLLNLLTAFFPFALWAFQPPVQQWYYAVPVVFVQATHLYLLWTDKAHVSAYRFLTLPVRRALQPVVMYLIKMESIKDKQNVAYLALDKIGSTKNRRNANVVVVVVEEILQSFRPSVRRRYKNVYKTFREAGIVVRSVQCETELDLRATLPILLQHQKRQCQIDGKNLVEEFVKRFLVVSVVPDGILDLFYKDDELVAFQMGTRQGAVYDWFMYFSRDAARQYGIWFYGILLSIVRAKTLPGVQWFNALTHLMDSKQMAGLQAVTYEDDEMMDTLFPWASTERMPDKALSISLEDEPEPKVNGTANTNNQERRSAE